MGKGSNYLNNDKGVYLQASKKAKAGTRMVSCQYGEGCNRPGCIYSHPTSSATIVVQSKEPCMAFLAGVCAFNGKGCRKRHPGKEETERLIAKYQTVRCRFGESCQTNGCLYRHLWDDDHHDQVNEEVGDKCSSLSTNHMCQAQAIDLSQKPHNSDFYGSGSQQFHQMHAQAQVSANWTYDEYFTASYDTSISMQQKHLSSLSDHRDVHTHASSNMAGLHSVQDRSNFEKHPYYNEQSTEGKNINAKEFVPSMNWK